MFTLTKLIFCLKGQSMGLNCYQCLSAVDEYCKRTSTVKQSEATPCDGEFCAVRMFIHVYSSLYLQEHQGSGGKVMFSVVSVHQLVILFIGGSHVTTTHDALDLTTQEPP